MDPSELEEELMLESDDSLTNLIVNYLPQTMSQDDMRTLFSSLGELESCKLIRDKNTGISKGVGFVRYDKRSEAEAAIKQLNGTIPAGSTEPITVKFANSPTAVTAKTTGMQLPLQAVAAAAAAAAASPINAAAAAAAAAVQSPYLAPTRRLVGPIHHQAARVRYSPIENSLALSNGLITGNSMTGAGWTLFVYNLAPETDESILWQLFGPFGAVQNVKVMRDLATQKCKGFGFVTMTNYDEALLAITALNGYQIGNRALQVSFKKAKGGAMFAAATANTPTIMAIPTLQ